MQRSSRGKLAFNCGPVKYNFCKFCINMCIGMERWAWKMKRHWFEAVFVSTWGRWTSNAAGWPEHRPAPVGETENAIRGTSDGNRMGNTPWTGLPKPRTMESRLVHLIPLLSWPNEALQSAAPAVDPGSISLLLSRMQLTCSRDVSNIPHVLVTSHKNHSDECLWQPFWQTLAWCQIVSQLF